MRAAGFGSKCPARRATRCREGRRKKRAAVRESTSGFRIDPGAAWHRTPLCGPRDLCGGCTAHEEARMASQPLDEETIFHRAREIASPEARASYLRQACGADEVLHARLQALLKVHEQENSFLAPPTPLPLLTAAESPREGPGTVLGPYKLLQQLGEGGMGSVWLAEQTEPVQRRVALKLIKPGLDSKPVLARFEAERQALALMDHPHIAKVLDAGTTDSGRPFFVMELVKGTPLTRYCDEK